MKINHAERTSLTEIATDYSVAISSACKGLNPDWACQDGFDIFFANVDSLIGELSVELNQSVCMVALDHDWRATCYRTLAGWCDMASVPVVDREVYNMVEAGVWMVVAPAIDDCMRKSKTLC